MKYPWRLHHLKATLNIFTSLSAPSTQEPSEQDLEDLWDEVSSELSAIFQGRSEIPTDVTPFDAASEVDVDEQRYHNFSKFRTL